MSPTDAEPAAAKPAAEPAVVSTRLSACFGVLDQVESQLRFADSKAGFIATLHAFLVYPIPGNVQGIRVVASADRPSQIILGVCAGIYSVLFLLSMAMAALTVLPRTRGAKRPPSKAFFGRIAREFGQSPERYVAELEGMSPADWVEQVGRYIVDASAIAAQKHRMVRWATVVTVPTVVFWLLTVLTLLCAIPRVAP